MIRVPGCAACDTDSRHRAEAQAGPRRAWAEFAIWSCPNSHDQPHDGECHACGRLALRHRWERLDGAAGEPRDATWHLENALSFARVLDGHRPPIASMTRDQLRQMALLQAEAAVKKLRELPDTAPSGAPTEHATHLSEVGG